MSSSSPWVWLSHGSSAIRRADPARSSHRLERPTSCELVDVPAGKLSVARWEGHGCPVVFLHGFTQRGPYMARLLAGRAGIAPDLPGHGPTDVDPIDMPNAVSSVATLLERIGPRVVVGYSMGGRVALHLALAHPALVERLLLISTGLGIADVDERSRRAAKDAALAHRILADGVDAFINDWIEHPVAGTWRLGPEEREADRRMRLSHARQRLAAALTGLGPSAHPPLHDRLGELEMPIVWMAGSADNEYAAVAGFGAARSDGKLVIVEGAGHNLVLEAPGAVIEQLDEISSSPPPQCTGQQEPS